MGIGKGQERQWLSTMRSALMTFCVMGVFVAPWSVAGQSAKLIEHPAEEKEVPRVGSPAWFEAELSGPAEGRWAVTDLPAFVDGVRVRNLAVWTTKIKKRSVRLKIDVVAEVLEEAGDKDLCLVLEMGSSWTWSNERAIESESADRTTESFHAEMPREAWDALIEKATVESTIKVFVREDVIDWSSSEEHLCPHPGLSRWQP